MQKAALEDMVKAQKSEMETKGPAIWRRLHTLALAWDGDKEGLRQILSSVTNAVPCGSCKKHWVELITAKPPACTTAEEFSRSRWTGTTQSTSASASLSYRWTKPANCTAPTVDTSRVLTMAIRLRPNFNLPDQRTGDTLRAIDVTLKINQVPVDLTGATVLIQVRPDPTSSTVSMTLATSFPDAANGVLRIDEQAVTLASGLYYYDLQITMPGGFRETYLTGTWQILQDVSR